MTSEANKRLKKSPQFVAFVKEPSSNDAARSVASSHGWSESCVHYGDIRQAIVYLSEQAPPKRLLVEIPSAEAAPELLDRLADVCSPNMQVIVSGSINEFSFYSWLKSIGIEHYLLQPFDNKTLDNTLYAKAKNGSVEREAESKVIAVIGARGGVGTTTVATNLAWILAEKFDYKTTLLDLDPYFGSAAMAFDIMPNHGLRDALDKPDRIDSEFLARVMVQHTDKLSVFSGEESFSELISCSSSAAEALIDELCEQFEYTVVDLPTHLSSLTRSVLAQADQIAIVTELSLLGLRDALRLQEFLKDANRGDSEPIIIANRKGLAGSHELSLQEFEKSLTRNVDIVLPFTRDAFLSTNSGELLYKNTKNTGVTEGFDKLAAHFIENGAESKPPEKQSLLSKILGRS